VCRPASGTVPAAAVSGAGVGYTPAAIALSRSGRTAYVVNTISGTLTPVSTRTARAHKPIGVGVFTYPTTLALSGNTAVVIGTYAGRVTLVNTRTRHVTARLKVGNYPVAVAIAARPGPPGTRSPA
jgi:YVTN family beta-propeller protein